MLLKKSYYFFTFKGSRRFFDRILRRETSTYLIHIKNKSSCKSLQLQRNSSLQKCLEKKNSIVLDNKNLILINTNLDFKNRNILV